MSSKHEKMVVEGIEFTIEKNNDGSYDYVRSDGRGFTSMPSKREEHSHAQHRKHIEIYLRTVTDDD